MQQIVRMMYFSRFQCGVVTLPSAMSHSVWKKLFDAGQRWHHSHIGSEMPHQYHAVVCLLTNLKTGCAFMILKARIPWIWFAAGYCGSWRLLWFRQCNPPFDLVASFALDMLHHLTPCYTMLHQCWSVELCGPSFGCCTIHSISLNFSSTYNW